MIGLAIALVLGAYDIRLHWGHETRAADIKVNAFEVHRSSNGQPFEKVQDVNFPTELNVSTTVQNLIEGVVYAFYVKPSSECRFFIDRLVLGLNLPDKSYELQFSNDRKEWQVWDAENHFVARGKMIFNRQKTPDFFRVVKKGQFK